MYLLIDLSSFETVFESLGPNMICYDLAHVSGDRTKLEPYYGWHGLFSF